MPKNSTKPVVLDAWAFLALIFKEEPAAGVVRRLFEDVTGSDRYVSWINLGEVYYVITRKQGTAEAEDALRDIRLLPLKIHEPRREDIIAAARLKAEHPLSYADAFAVGLARKVEGTLYTGDPEIIRLEGVVSVLRLRRG